MPRSRVSYYFHFLIRLFGWPQLHQEPLKVVHEYHWKGVFFPSRDKSMKKLPEPSDFLPPVGLEKLKRARDFRLEMNDDMVKVLNRNYLGLISSDSVYIS